MASLGSLESLWVDELHTSWVITDSYPQIAERARAGNQSPLYFQPLWCWVQAVGQSEAALRGPSTLATALAAGLICWWLCRRAQAGSSDACENGGASADGPPAESQSRAVPGRWLAATIALTIAGLIGLDRIQLFYASEARVYAILQALHLCGWLCVIACAVSSRLPVKLLVAWSLLAALTVHLHVISLIPVAWQAACLLAGSLWNAGSWANRTRQGWLSVAAVATTGLLSAPAVLAAAAVWGRRDQWESFAGDTRWETVSGLFPWWQLLLVAAVFRCIDLFIQRGLASCPPASTSPTKSRRQFVEPLIWLIAVGGPWLTAWLVTSWEIAPILHRRYVLCSSLPLVALATWQLLPIHSGWLRGAALLTMLSCLTISQGTLEIWRNGQLIGWQRGEDWRAASSWIDQGYREGDETWCASGLIEGTHLKPPLTPEVNAYLSFPFRGIYATQASSEPPQALVGDASYWLQQWLEHGSTGERRLYVVARCDPELLVRILMALQPAARQAGVDCQAIGPVRAFGSLSGVRLSLISRVAG